MSFAEHIQKGENCKDLNIILVMQILNLDAVLSTDADLLASAAAVDDALLFLLLV